jgi:DNA-binding Lrp family transcriptional regulator
MGPDVAQKPVQLTSRDKKLIESLSSNFPVVARPFQVLAEQFDMDEASFIEWVTELVEAGQIKSFHPTLDIEVKEE